ncbi:tripartite tricarboxylate transporter TctB family protein [Granulosicoccus sp.]|nr:tripartite tricarboxylate transporter TctB family protein [Granulosicoccus sp.]MDB4222974.1 tripartite tricarboxylate transporter TctB family protein [Granulosicoccus sp.]
MGFIGIPFFVSSPSNVRNIVLAPTFWPYVLTALTGLIAICLLLVGWRMVDDKPTEQNANPETSNRPAWIRLAILALIMVLTMFALPRIGMVWTAMLVFVATAYLFKTRHPKLAIICAVVIPLLLYLFFAHVAGVAIPQGNFVRLP